MKNLSGLSGAKEAYRQRVLRDHPDKGGSDAAFQATRAAWAVLKSQ